MTGISVEISSSEGAALLTSFLLILLKPLGLLIRNNCALMFGPLACEVYLWAVWEDTHAYHMHTYTNGHFHLLFLSNKQTRSPTATGVKEVQRCWSIHNRLTTEIGPYASPVLNAAFLVSAKATSSFLLAFCFYSSSSSSSSLPLLPQIVIVS